MFSKEELSNMKKIMLSADRIMENLSYKINILVFSGVLKEGKVVGLCSGLSIASEAINRSLQMGNLKRALKYYILLKKIEKKLLNLERIINLKLEEELFGE